MSTALAAGTAISSAERKSSSTMPYFSWSRAKMPSFTRSLPASWSKGRLPIKRLSCSAETMDPMVFLAWSPARWGSRSPTVNWGSPGSSPMRTETAVPSRRTTTPWRARGMVVHWYFLMPP